MVDAIITILPFGIIFALMYFVLFKRWQRKANESGPANFLSTTASFDVHRSVANGVQLTDVVDAFGRAAFAAKSKGVSMDGDTPVGQAALGKWDIRISSQKSETNQKILYRANFNSIYTRILFLIAGIFIFLIFSNSLYVVDVLAGMRRGGVDTTGAVPQFIAWVFVILLKFVAPMFAIMFAVSPSLFARRNIEKIIDKSLKEF